ncbi:MAG: hypothetical protein AUI49_03650 [Candidatus Rokubacteria bacterium 13_1_40CM_2_68_13]|nr:MAG: hypothetical protein AUI49_03650 [Candidatus Rokubacteria bacterium 13_1_40CM_2_68_13]
MISALRTRSARVRSRFVTSLAMAVAHVPSFPDVRAGWAMSKSQVVLNVFMAGLSLVFAVRIADAVFRRGPVLPIRVASSANTPPSASPALADSRRSPASHDLIPARNLFHPDRAQPKRSDALGALPVAPALLLYGVVWSEENPLAYVEDPTSKKIFGYKTGDAMAGGYIERIEMDRIIIHRQDGPLEVMLRAPNKPRPVAAATAPTEAATPSAPQPAPTVDGVSPGIPRGIVRRNRD